jgi:hypothetical protein
VPSRYILVLFCFQKGFTISWLYGQRIARILREFLTVDDVLAEAYAFTYLCPNTNMTKNAIDVLVTIIRSGTEGF